MLFGTISKNPLPSLKLKIYPYMFVIRTDLLKEVVLVKKGVGRMGGLKNISGRAQNIPTATEKRAGVSEGRN